MKLTAVQAIPSAIRIVITKNKTAWLAMKLTTLLIVAICLQVSARGLAQEKITFSGKNIPFEKVIDVIQDQAGYVFFYKHDILQEIRNITLSVKDADVEEVLRTCFKGQPIDFSIKGRTIFLLKKEETPAPAPPAKPELKGFVRNEAGGPLVGATITIVNGSFQRSAVTNNQGEYSFKDLPVGTYRVEISFIGYETYKKTATLGEGLVEVNAVLRPAVSGLDESVVKGYYTTSKRFNTGDVTTVKGEDIAKQPVSDPMTRWKEGFLDYIFRNSQAFQVRPCRLF